MRTHEKLEVWKRAVEFVVTAYRVTESFPKDERFDLTSQVRRAAVSIPTNIAEGAARASNKEFVYFLSIAQGSASELSTELLIACRLGFLDSERLDLLSNELNEVGRMLSGLCKYLRSKSESEATTK
jgi:four helix bundle protein